MLFRSELKEFWQSNINKEKAKGEAKDKTLVATSAEQIASEEYKFGNSEDLEDPEELEDTKKREEATSLEDIFKDL